MISDQHQGPSPDQSNFTRQHNFTPPRVKHQPSTIVGSPAVPQKSACASFGLGGGFGPAQSQDEVAHLGSRSQHSTARLVSHKRKNLLTLCVDHESYSSTRKRSEQNKGIPLLSTQATATTVRQSKMLRELYPHNDGPPIGIHPSIGLHTPSVDSDEDSRPLRMTRTQARDYQRRTRNEPKTPQKSLNVRRMMREQLRRSSEKSDLSISSPASSKVQSPLDKSRTRTMQPILVNRGVPLSSEVEDYHYSLCWKGWEDSKGL